jgi:hypothetical protein
MAEWAEEEHPRSEGGKFSIKEGAVAVRAK